MKCMKDGVDKLLSRREFLKKSITLAAAATSVPSFVSRTALAIEDPKDPALVSSKPGVPDDQVLVVVQLSGGNDGLNSVIPFTQDGYYKLRPSLAIPGDKVIRLNDDLGLHPSLAPLKDLYDNSQLAIVQGVGYPNPDRSHFRSMEIWQSARVESFETKGWIGRVFDHSCNNSHLNDCSPTRSISVGNTLNPALRGVSGTGVAVRNPEHLYRMTRLFSSSSPESGAPKQATPDEPSALDFLRRTALNAELSADRIRRSVRQVQNRADYPRNPFAQGLQLIAGMIAGGMDTRVYYISLTGFDTHANQRGVHERLLTTFSGGLAAFQKDLGELGHAERVLGMVFSEFGRRVAENGSRGTDHGQAAPMFIFGAPVRPGLQGMHPSLDALADGDLHYHTDFRSVYATVLEDWLHVDSQIILGAQFEKVPIV
jgi:uncharacterized protein (DUF1501 family)